MSMSKIEEIEKEVEGLKPDELQAFRKWFWDFDAEAWDRQFEKDALSGKLDSLAEAALKSFKSGHCSEIWNILPRQSFGDSIGHFRSLSKTLQTEVMRC